MRSERLSILITLFVFLSNHVVGDPFVPRPNIPDDRPIPLGYARASNLAQSGNSIPLRGPIRPLGVLSPVSRDVAPISSSNQAPPPKDPFQDSNQVVQPKDMVPQKQPQIISQQEPTQQQITELLAQQQQQQLAGRAPVGPVAVPQTQYVVQPPPQQQQQQIVYVPVPIQVPAQPVAPVPTPAPNLPSWMTNPLSGNLPWNGKK